jgi:hypothetical protein
VLIVSSTSVVLEGGEVCFFPDIYGMWRFRTNLNTALSPD